MSKTYAADGVDLNAGDEISRYAARAAGHTSSPFAKMHDKAPGRFRGPRSFSLHSLPEGYTIDFAPDGIGTKTVLISEALSHRTAGRDLLAMTAGDLTRYGGLPIVFSNVLDVRTLGKPGSETFIRFTELFDGLAQAAIELDVLMFRGETAELGVCVGSENSDALTQFNWIGFMMGAYHKDKLITGEDLRAGQPIVAVRETGFRSNGISAVRKALANKFGVDFEGKWWLNPDAKAAVREASTPSTLCDRFLTRINGWYSKDFQPLVRPVVIAHITGGGIPSKFGEDILFPHNLSALLDRLFDPPVIMRKCAGWRGFETPEEIYETWNGGQCLLVVLRNDLGARHFMRLAEQSGLEVRLAGRTCENDASGPALRIMSKFNGKEGEELTYRPK